MAGEWMQFCEEVSWGPSMPLVRGQIIGYDATLMVFEFTMIDKTVTAVVECQISSVAMDQLAGGRKGTMPVEREAQFLHLRHAIERIASDLYDEGLATPSGLIRIFHHHIR
jgi:Protein of unknown function (DUF1488)